MAKILIVEDDKEIGRLLFAYLRQQGYDAIIAENGLSALAVLQDRKSVV